MAALSGKYLELATDGVDLSDGGRKAVILAVRRIMLSAHRTGVPWIQVENVLTDQRNYRLAQQFAGGKYGKPMRPSEVSKVLKKLWDDTAAVVAKSAPWESSEIGDAIEYVRDQFSRAPGLTRDQRAVMNVVLDLATARNTTRVAVPARDLGERTGLSKSKAHRVLEQLCATEWLSLAHRGNHRTRRASLYQLAPNHLNAWGALRAPKSQTPPMSHVPPMSHEMEDEMTESTVTFALTQEEAAEVAALVARLKNQEAPVDRTARLRVVGGEQ